MKIDIGGRCSCVEEKKQVKRKGKKKTDIGGRCSCVEEKKQEKKEVWMKKKTKERKENNIRNKKSKLRNIIMIFSQ